MLHIWRNILKTCQPALCVNQKYVLCKNFVEQCNLFGGISREVCRFTTGNKLFLLLQLLYAYNVTEINRISMNAETRE
jgi:hypothetical protein